MTFYLKENELSFGFNYIIGASKVKLKRALDGVTNLEELEVFKSELDEFYFNMPEIEDIGSYPIEETIAYTDVKNPIQSKRNIGRVENHIGGDQKFIIQALTKKNWFYELLNNRIKELQKSKDLSNEIIEQSVPNLSIEEIFDFIKSHFQIDVKKDLFISEEKFSDIIISGIPLKLSTKELTKYQIGYLFEYFFKEFSNLRSRVMFSYRGQGQKDGVEYQEAIRSLNDKRKEIASGKTTDRILVKFADNLEKEFNKFTEENKTS